jgi:manganese oxidase
MNANQMLNSLSRVAKTGAVALMLCLSGHANALVEGWEGDKVGTVHTFSLTARDDFISTSDGNSHYTWGYAHGTTYAMQYPGPTLIVNQGDTVNIVLNNTLPVPVSIVFPGQKDVIATGGSPGVLTREAPAAPSGSTVPVQGPTYSFIAAEPGTYLYHSGTNADLQVEMGLVGAIIVRPTGFAYGDGTSHPNRKAYRNDATKYDRETLFLLTEMDPAVHWTVYGQVYSGQPVQIDTTTIKPSMWFINGRNAPDTQLDSYVYWLPTQPYNALPRMHPGEKLLMRMVNAGRELHPFHHHGNHALPIAKDGRVLNATMDNAGVPDITAPDFTVRAVPGQTMDLIYEWTGKSIGWDIYGTVAQNPHSCTPDLQGYDTSTREWCADHNKPIPVTIPGQLDLSAGEHYGGSPFLGLSGSLPQGHPGLNTTGGYYHMWHSHNEKEVTTDDIFPGGMMTMLIIEPWSVDLDAGTGTGGYPGGGGGVAPPPAIPTLAVLDTFNRGNANTLGNTWQQLVFLGNSGIRTNSNQAFCVNNAGGFFGGLINALCANGANAYRSGAAGILGASQAAAITFANATVDGVSLLLEAGGTYNTLLGVYPSAIRVRYASGQVAVETTTDGLAYASAGTLTGAFASGDTMTSMVDGTGKVYVWKTSGAVTTLLGSAQTALTGGGRIGLHLPPGARVVNFAGGTP